VTVFDGRTATRQLAGSRSVRITGSPEFLADRAGADVVAPVRAKLTGSPPPRGVAVAGFRRLRHVGAALFRTSTSTIRQVAAGRPPHAGTAYPGLDVTVEPAGRATLACDGTPVHLADGSPVTVVVVPINAEGGGECSSSSDGSSTGIMVLSENAQAGTLSYVVAGDGVISLSGRAVTPQSAAAIARALRPV